MNFYLLLLLRLIFFSLIALSVAYIATLVLLDLINHINIDWQKFFITFPIKKTAIGSFIAGVAIWISFILEYNQSTWRGKQSLDILTKQGYKAEINEISPSIKIPFYKINGELFYNYAPSSRNMSFVLSGIKKIAKHAEPKNIVINLVDSPVDFKKFVQNLVASFNNKLNKIIIINKQNNAVIIKDGNWLNVAAKSLLYQCPCCGEHTLNRLGKEEVCPICGWIDDPLQSLDPEFSKGLNKISLNEAITLNQKAQKKDK